MRIVIQKADTQDYFDGILWGDDLEKAMDFESVAQAEQYCVDQRFTSALIVVKFKDSTHDISYPIGSGNTPLVAKSYTKRFNRVALK
jgi:hypothetical protein